MNELLLNILSVVVTTIIIPLITFLGIKLNTYLKSKVQNEKMQNYLDASTKAVTLAVTTTMQTYVDNLKKSGNFTAEAQQEAFKRAKEKALTLITQDAKNALKALYGDFNEWLTLQIETTVKNLK